MKYAPLFAVIIVLALAGPGFPIAGDHHAHTALTDGVRATSSADDPAWVTLFADSTQLPKRSYSGYDFCYWGTGGQASLDPTGAPDHYRYLVEAGLLGARVDINWYAMHGADRKVGYDLWGTDANINKMHSDGFSIIGCITYTPPWTNGYLPKSFAPNKPVDTELVDLSSGIGQLAHDKLVVNPSDYFYPIVAPDPLPKTRIVEEIITNNFKKDFQWDENSPRTSKKPVVVGTEQVWVNEGSGWEKWTRIDNLAFAADGAKVYQFDRNGKVRFKPQSLFYKGRTPVEGSRVKISYDHITDLYTDNVDYTIDRMKGQIIPKFSSLDVLVANEPFETNTLNSNWKWMSAPSSFTVNSGSSGTLKMSVSNHTWPGTVLYQNLAGEGDFTMHTRVKSLGSKVGTCTGLIVYKDANNWFAYYLSYSQYRPLLVQMINGVMTSKGWGGELGWMCTVPRWLTVRKSGNSYTVFTSSNSLSGPDGGYQWSYTFTQDLSFPVRIGTASYGTDTDVEIDHFQVSTSRMRPGSKVRVSYNYLDVEPWQDYCRKVVTHWKDKIKYWEIWNEPDQYWCWNGLQDNYAIMVQEASKVIKEVDPEAKVSVGGYANGANGNLGTVYETIDKSHFDYTAWHPYLFSNRAPDNVGWMVGPHSVGRSIMERNGDGHKEVFFGEFGADSGVLSTGGGLNDRKQAEYGTRLFMMSRRLEWVKAIQWWLSGEDGHFVGDHEDDAYGSHRGLFYRSDNGKTALPKPIYYAYRNVASNKGFLIDLVNYDSNDNPVPASATQPVKKVTIGLLDRAAVKSIKVFTSLTNTATASKPVKVAARHIGQAGAKPIVISVNTASPNLAREKWTVTATSATSFTVTGAVSGAQGTATVGQSFTSANGVVTFTIPLVGKAYIPGDKFEFETFVGDDYVERFFWQNDGSIKGKGEITLNLPQAVDARYVSIHFVKADSAQSIKLDEIEIKDSSDNVISQNKYYLVEGYQSWFKPNTPAPQDPPLPAEKPEISLVLTGAPKQPIPGQEVEMTLVYQNTSNVAAANVTINFPIPENTSYVEQSVSSGGVYDQAGKALRWVIPTLAPNGTGTLTFKVKID